MLDGSIQEEQKLLWIGPAVTLVLIGIILFNLAFACTRLQATPGKLIEDLERSGLRMGKPLYLGQEFRLESLPSEVAGIPLSGYRAANAALILDDKDCLVGASIANPNYEGYRADLDEVVLLTSAGVPILNMTREMILSTYGEPSKVSIPKSDETWSPTFTYYFQHEEKSLVTVIFRFRSGDVHMKKLRALDLQLSTGVLAEHIIESKEDSVFEWPT